MKTIKKTKNNKNQGNTLKIKKPTVHDSVVKKAQSPDPMKFVWSAILLFFIDYILFQKPLNSFLSWLLLVIPLTFLAISFSIWAYRKQFPFNSFPWDPIFAGNLLNDERSNTIHSIMMLIICIFVIIILTCNLVTP